MKAKKRIFNRFTALILLVAVIFSIISYRLYDLQIVHGEEAKAKADSSTIKDIEEPAPRGQILDNNGEVLATSTVSYSLVYNETEESSKKFYETLGNMFKLIDSTGEKLLDDFPLKLEPYRFEFKTADPQIAKAKEAVFKNERGFSEYLLSSDFGKKLGKKEVSKLTKEERDELDKELLKITPEETFKFMIKELGLYKILNLSAEENKQLAKKDYKEVADIVLNKVPAAEIRKYMLVRDAVNMKIYSASKNVVLANNLKKDSAFRFMQKNNNMDGISVTMEPERIYPYGSFASHVLGFLAPINAENKDKYEGKGYDINKDYVGTYGIEGSYENILRGNKTVKTVKVDKQGRAISNLFELEGYPGSSVQLSINKNLQNAAEKSLDATMKSLQNENRKHGAGDSGNATRGAVVVINVKTGKILALASNPSFDPNLFAVPGRITTDIYKKYFDPDYEAYGKQLISHMNLSDSVDQIFPKDKDGNRYDKYDVYPKPFLNYATQGLSPVGSIFKPFTALVGLEEGVIDKNTVVHDTGVYQREELQGYKAQNDSGVAHGDITITDALKVSSNIFFLETGYRLFKLKGLNSLAKWSWKLGLGNDPKEGYHTNTGIEINENIYGNVYNFESKKKLIGMYAYDELASVLNKGTTRSGEPMPKLDIAFKSDDTAEIKEAKQAIDNALNKFWMNIQIGDEKTVNQRMEELVDAIDNNLNALIEKLPADKKQGAWTSAAYAEQYSMYAIFDRYQELMTPVNVMNAAIGQGDAELTILQIANALATLVNGGTRYRTSVVEKILDAEGNTSKIIEPEVIDSLSIKKENLDTIKEGMYKVNNDPNGTAYSEFSDFPIKTAGKTGSAEYLTAKDGHYGRNIYGTYVAFAPYDNPEIAVASIVYDSIHGSYITPVTRAIFEEYFKDELAKKYPDYKRKYVYELKPTIDVSPSLLKLKNPPKVEEKKDAPGAATKPQSGTTVPNSNTNGNPGVSTKPEEKNQNSGSQEGTSP